MSPLQLVDDLLFVIYANHMPLLGLKDILDRFELEAGRRINKCKSKLVFSANSPQLVFSANSPLDIRRDASLLLEMPKIVRSINKLGSILALGSDRGDT